MSLTVSGLHAHYGKSHILQGVDIAVAPKAIVTLLGRNGAGKTTTLKAISGVVPPTGGTVSFDGETLAGLPVHEIVRRGVALVPEHRGIFTTLSVEENLAIAQRKGAAWSLADVFDLFPRLAERRRNAGGHLSGGEQQMLSIARALLTGPRLLMLDEPTEGLAPVVVQALMEALRRIAGAGVAILLVEQNLRVCQALGMVHTVIELGRTVFTGSFEALTSGGIAERHLGVEVA